MAINATTVEVTYKDAVKDVNATKYTIEGLTVTNAAVKQTDSKTVVLTTATQTGAKEYTLKSGAIKIGTFKGISAVTPSAIKVTTPTVQGTIGKEVTVKAEVTVAEGQSKAGIPVTFNIVNDNSNLNSKIEVEAFTDEKGVATYSYTRYYKHNDNVTAYATEKSSVYSSGKVYWAEGLTLTEVTTGNELANGAKKVYKVATDDYNTATDANGAKYNYVNVAFVENTDVSPDKLVRDVEILDTGIITDSTYTQSKYPSQVTTGGVQTVRVKVNANGEATFTLTGSNASVTPVVFVDNNSSLNGKLTKTALQASAPTVKFALSHTLGLTVKAEGVQNAAAITDNGNGGRDYTVALTDKDGKIAPEGTVVSVVFPSGSFSADKTVNFNKKVNNITNSEAIVKDKVYTVAVGKDGKATFTLTGLKDGFATPTVFVDNGSEDNKLDKNDLQTVGEQTFFVNAVINNATLVSKVEGKEVTSTSGEKPVAFIYTSIDQNGKEYDATPSNYEVSYEVKAQFGDVRANDILVQKGTTKTVKINAVDGVATLNVVSVDPTIASQVIVNASASQVSLPNKEVTFNFTASNVLPATYTGNATYNDPKDEITFVGYKAVSYASATFKDVRSGTNATLTKAEFETLLASDKAAGKYSLVTSVRDSNGNYSFEYKGAGTTSPVAPTPTVVTRSEQVKGVEGKAAVFAKYTSAVIETSNFPDSSFIVTNNNGKDVTVNVLGTDSAGQIANKINEALAAAAVASTPVVINANATAENGRVVIKATNTDSVGVKTSGIPTVFSNSISAATPSVPAVAGDYDYTFTTDITVGKTISLNGVIYTAGTQARGLTFNASGTLAQDLTNLAAAITYNDDKVDANASATVLTVVEEAGKEGTVNFTDLIISAN